MTLGIFGMGFISGFAVCFVLIFILSLLNRKPRTVEDLRERANELSKQNAIKTGL